MYDVMIDCPVPDQMIGWITYYKDSNNNNNFIHTAPQRVAVLYSKTEFKESKFQFWYKNPINLQMLVFTH